MIKKTICMCICLLSSEIVRKKNGSGSIFLTISRCTKIVAILFFFCSFSVYFLLFHLHILYRGTSITITTVDPKEEEKYPTRDNRIPPFFLVYICRTSIDCFSLDIEGKRRRRRNDFAMHRH